MGLNGMDMGGGKVLSVLIIAHKSKESQDDKEEIEGSLSVPGVGNISPIVPSTITAGVPPIMRHVDGVDVEGLIDAAMGLSPMPTIDFMAGYRGLMPTISREMFSSHLYQKVDEYESRNSDSRLAVTLSIPSVNEFFVPDNPTGYNSMGEFNVAKASLNAACVYSDDEATTSRTKTCILVLLNMVTNKDLATYDDYEIPFDEVMGDVKSLVLWSA